MASAEQPDVAATTGLDAALIAQTILRDGQSLVERRFGGAALDQPANIKSASKP